MPTLASLAQLGANTVYAAFVTYQAEFKNITQRAQARFETSNWHGAHDDAVERLELYPRLIRQTLDHLRQGLGETLSDKTIWAQIKPLYIDHIAQRVDIEIAETFFNSVTRRVFTTVGVDPNIEFVESDFAAPSLEADAPFTKIFLPTLTTEARVKTILEAYPFHAPYENLERDVRLAAAAIDAQYGATAVPVIEMFGSVFYRGKGAYLVGRLREATHTTPLIFALLHEAEGIRVDAVLLAVTEASIVFSFTRSYFRVETACPRDLIAFLHSILPQKRIAELYIGIGYNKHGKTELYRALLSHLRYTQDKFELTYGDRGMVMAAFTLPGLNIVLKIIKDTFAFPKVTTRQEVMDKYQLVFTHDRAGRLVDAQEFEYLTVERSRFQPDLLQELLSVAAHTVTADDQWVVIKHAYIERRVTPLNLYLRKAEATAAREAILDYGQAIRDLAATDIFPGDMLLKNFGVTRQGRVIFYDYDELCSVTECHFRELPPPQDIDEEMSGEPWFYVGEKDIFPEEFIRFFGLTDELRAVFLQAHGELLTATFWRQMQARHRAGEIMDIFPYKTERRLKEGS